MIELAFYMSLRKNPDVQFVSIAKHKAGVVVSLLILVFYFVADTMLYFHVLHVSDDDIRIFRYILIVLFVIQISACSVLIYFGRQFFRSLDALQQAEAEFDVRKCELGRQEDLPFLLSSIEHFFGGVRLSPNPTEDESSGIDQFNQFVRSNLRAHAPFDGLRSCCILGYIPAVILGSGLLAKDPGSYFQTLDLFAGGNGGQFGFDALRKFSFGDVVYLIWVPLVYGPLEVYIYSALVKLLWFIEKRCALLPWYVLYPLFLAFDIFLPVRAWLMNISVTMLIEAALRGMGVYEPGGPVLATNPFIDLPFLFTCPKKIYGLGWLPSLLSSKNFLPFSLPAWGKVLALIWFVCVTLFTYIVYEPICLHRYRSKCLKWLRSKSTK